MSLTRDSNVKQLLELFNESREIKYKDVMDLFNVSRDLIKSRLKTIGLAYDQHEKKFLGDVTEDDLNIQLLRLFEKQRGNKSPKVARNEQTNVRTNELKQQGSFNQTELFNAMWREVAGTKEQTNVIRKRASFDIDMDLLKELKVKAVLHDRNVYEIVEDAIRKYLDEM